MELKQKIDDAELHQSLGDVNMRFGKSDEARARYQKADDEYALCPKEMITQSESLTFCNKNLTKTILSTLKEQNKILF